jgi:N-acetylmuramoyl-L-alanine amidase
MRHWSNPTSTRIAIDLGGKVEYEAARVPNPERIFFDLHGTRLASSLNGHQVEVIDDGYLKRIRAAQFQADTTRVVLDVSDVSQYSAFLLPNPWRLIIDIHSDKGASKQAIAKSQETANETLSTGKTVATVSANEPALPLGVGRNEEKKRGEKDSTISEVAKLSSEPSKVAATVGPTSGPVAAKAAMPQNELDAMNGPSASAADQGKLAESGTGSAARSTAGGSGRGKKGKNSATSVTTASAADSGEMPHAADPTADGQRSLVRALGLKVGRIVIDAGHGGHDSGTLGPGGIQEKDVVLDVALRVGKLLHQRLGAEIVYTRSDDTFIPLETRTAIANRAQADLFLSIHGNSSPEPSARGVETYYLNFTSDPDALDTAARENAVSTQSVHQLSDLVRKITLKDKIDESREFAADVDQGLYAGLRSGNPGLKDRGVKKAPFVVLIGAQMPSILAEISFLTNPDDAEQLREGAYRQRIAEALDTGVERYLHGLSGTRGTDATRSPSKRAAKSRVDGELPVGQ